MKQFFLFGGVKLVDFANAIKKPFTDVKTLVIGVIVGAIPILSLLTTGYGLRTAEKTLEGKKEAVDWFEDLGGLIIKTVMSIIISFIYLLPALIVFVVAGLQVITSLFTAGAGGAMDAKFLSTLLAALGPAIGMFLIGLLLLLIAAFLLPSAYVNYVKNKGFGSAFSFGIVLKKAFSINYIVSWIVGIIWMFVLAVIMMVLSIVPVIGTLIGAGLMTFAGTTAFYSMMAEACK